MITTFESMVRLHPDRVCFSFVDENGGVEEFSYRKVRFLSAGLANVLRRDGVEPGDGVSVDMPNCPEFVFLMLAAAYGGFSLVVLNNRLTPSEKLTRVLEIERTRKVRIAARLDGLRVRKLLKAVRSDLSGGRSHSGHRRIIMGAQQDAEEEVIHFAERSAHLFDKDACALIMFTSGTTGKPKAVSLRWAHIMGSAAASNATLGRQGVGLWQAALPLFHVGGFQVVVRSILSRAPFFLYARFDAHRLLSDAVRYGVTHVSVVDKMLQDMLDENVGDALQAYRCILLGGGAMNRKTLARAYMAKARVYVSYGMTETSSQIANELVASTFDGGMRLMPGYAARIVDADEEGYGRLAVKGPGVFEGYLNARAAFTVDGFFLTGDTAALRGGKLYVKERTDDMFVSGGENVYPAEIVDKLVGIPGVADAYVFGVPDEVWGRRPVAFVERAKGLAPAKSQGFDAPSHPAASPAAAASAAPGDSGALRLLGSSGPLGRIEPSDISASAVKAQLKGKLSKIYLPKHLCMVDELPRTGIGKVDRAAVERLYEQRLEVKRVALHHVRLPFKVPFKTAKATLYYRDSLIVEVTDHAGRTGLGECVSFATDWYLPETLGQDTAALQHALAPLVLSEVYLHPRQVAASFAAVAGVEAFPMACGALEPALWDLYGKIVGKPLWQLVNEEMGASLEAARSVQVAAGAVVGMGTPRETVESVRRCMQAGYRRVKLKVAPGALECVRAVREAFPHMAITLDANQSFTEMNLKELYALDSLGALWIEEPLAGGAGEQVWKRLAQLQRRMRTPLCLDESVLNVQDAQRALAYPELRCFAVKIGKFGGVKPTLDFIAQAQKRDVVLWMGGMYDTGVSKRLHAAFQTVRGISAAGDIGATSRYFGLDVTTPPYTVERGLVTLNRESHPYGLGCSLHAPSLSQALVKTTVIE